MLLIVTNKSDAHVDYTISRAAARHLDRQIVRLNTEDFLNNVTYSFDGERIQLIVRDSGVKFRSDEISGVWYRRPEKAVVHQSLDNRTAGFIQDNVAAFLRGLYHCTERNARWLNPYEAERTARNKVVQLLEARRAGLAVPQTLISNCHRDLTDFLTNRRVCIKPLNVDIFIREGLHCGLFTQEVTSTHISDSTAEQLDCPSIFQELLEKRSEARVVAIGNNVYAFRSTPRNDPIGGALDGTDASIDFRRVNLDNMEIEEIKLKNDFHERIRTMLASLSLQFSSMDFILTDGEPVFLDLNPNGQWLWLELRTGVRLADSILDFFFGNSDSS